MSNQITEKYFQSSGLVSDERSLIETVYGRTGFKPGKRIFAGKIYDQDKVGSLIYQGEWRGQDAVLKVQVLKPEIDEAEIIKRFNAQNNSRIIRLPKILANENWTEKAGYGFQIMEVINAPRIYEPPLANKEQRADFLFVYEEYRKNCLNRPFIAQGDFESESLGYTLRRVGLWRKIGESKGYLSTENRAMVDDFRRLAAQHLPSVRMDFMHGHFYCDDIRKVSDGEYVLMSNLFWSWRPEYYDAAFHLWAGLKALRDLDFTVDDAWAYLEDWRQVYIKIPFLEADRDFDRKFDIMLAERCIGAILVDIENQHYDRDRAAHVAHLKKMFRGIFDKLNFKLTQHE